jgi:hypothetical protein
MFTVLWIMQKIVMRDQMTQFEITKSWHELQMFWLEITEICDVNFICFSWRSQKFVMWTSHVLVGDQNNLWHVVLHMFWLYFTKNLCCGLQMTWLEFTLEIPWQNIWCSSLQMGCKAWTLEFWSKTVGLNPEARWCRIWSPKQDLQYSLLDIILFIAHHI